MSDFEPSQIEIEPCGPLQAVIRPPGSKSITNRALICAALAKGKSTLCGALDSEDTRVMIDSLQRLGIDVSVDLEAQSIEVAGRGGNLSANDVELFVGNSGTTIRFLTALVALGGGQYRLDGVERMRQRPIGDLLDALNQLGADAKSEAANGCPPVTVRGGGLRGGRANVRGDISSQFLSGLLMAAPYAENDVELVVEGALVSKPYIRITLDVMQAFGVSVDAGSFDRFVISAAGKYKARRYEIEPDASAASYFWAAAAIAGGRTTVQGLTAGAMQGDVAFVDCLEKMGCRLERSENAITVIGGKLRGIEIDMNAISDTVQTLAAVALFAEGPTKITGVAHIRHKETDRIGDLARELQKLGAEVDEFEDGLKIDPVAIHGAEIDTYDDHRMAMSLALVGLKIKGVVINDPQCTAKTYPRFFEDLESLRR